MLERWLARAHARLRCLPVPPGGDGRCPGQRTQAFRPSRAEVAAGADSRARWLAAYEDVRRRHLAGEALLATGRATGLARATVRKYAHAESFPERAVRRPGRSILDPFIAHLEARMAEGCEDAMVLWREVRGRGYAHGHKVVQQWVAENRTRPAPRTPRRWLLDTPASAASGPAPDPGQALPSPKQLAWLLVRPATALSPLGRRGRQAGRAGHGGRPGRLPRTSVHCSRPRVQRWATNTPRCPRGRLGRLARRGACVRYRRRRDVRRRAGAGWRRSACRAHRILEQRPG